jgi:hypothetical protein
MITLSFDGTQLPEAGQYQAQSKIKTIYGTEYYGEVARFSLYNTLEEVQ